MTDITRKRGDTYADVFQITSKVTGMPVDITGFAFLLTVDPEKAPVSNTNNLFQITGAITDAPNGKVGCALSAPQADHLGSYFFDLQMTDDQGKIRTVDSGKYKFVQDITK